MAKREDPLVGKRVRIDADVAQNADGAICLWGGTEATIAGAERRSGGKVYLLQPDDADHPQPFPMSAFTVMPLADGPADSGTAAAPAGEMVHADPNLVAFSLDNPRKRRGLDLDSLTALASSIKAQGLAQPILVRPLPGTRQEDTFRDRADGMPLPTYELVCGERRLRACMLAGLESMPMLVRPLSDEQALELQLVENIEREDLDPVEEAEGFELLRTRLNYTAEQIAERIGRGRGKDYVYKTMKLLELTPESREALHEGHLGRSTGLLVARYPAAKQAAVVDYIKALATKGEPAPFRVVQPQVFRRFNLGLSTAVWTIGCADLVPAAGACTSCPKRTGAHADLFGDDGDSEDSCTDPDCFESKRVAHIAQVKARAEKEGIKVIDGEDAQQVVPSAWSRYLQGYSRVTDTAYTEKGDDGTERMVTFEDALRAKGKKAPKPSLLINPHTGEAIKVISNDLADQLMPADEEPPVSKRGSRLSAPKEDTRPEEEKAFDDYSTRRAVLLRVFDTIRNRDRTDADMLLIARALFGGLDDALHTLENYLSWTDAADADDPNEWVQQKLLAMPAAELAATLTMAAAELVMNGYHFTRTDEVAVAAQYGVDVLAVRDKVAEDLARQEAGEEDKGDGGQPSTDDDQQADAKTPVTPIAVKKSKAKRAKAPAVGAEPEAGAQEARPQAAAPVINPMAAWPFPPART